jgi:hypothetical protein
MAENVVSAVRASRKTPAIESTSTAPPTADSADPATVTSTLDPVKRPDETPSKTPGLPGEVGDEDPPPHAEKIAPIVAPDAAWQAPAQNFRRDTILCDANIRILARAGVPERRCRKIEATREPRFFVECASPKAAL